MRYLIAVKGCERDALNGTYRVLRETWFDHLPVTAFLFCGQSTHDLSGDEVRLPCPDDYMNLPTKTKHICRWMLERDYSHVFLCDTDTYVRVAELLKSGFQKYDIAGWFNGPLGIPKAVDGYWSWLSGGNGYWLSRKAAEIVRDFPLGEEWAEDRMVGQALGPSIQKRKIKALHHAGYGNGNVTLHYCSHHANRTFDKEWLYQMHARYS